MIDIRDTSGKLRFSTPVNAGSKRKFLLMKEDYITLKFSLDQHVYFRLGDYVDDPCFGLFELCDLYKPTFNNSNGGYDYELRLDAYYWKWKNKIFKFTPETGGQEASWNLTASLDVQLGIFLRNLQALGYTYKGTNFEFSIDKTVENSAKLMSYDSVNLLDALSRLAEAWGCEWWMKGRKICFGRCEEGDPVDFEFGKNVESMTRSEGQGIYATRIYAFGSTRNIPVNYRPSDENIVANGIVQKRLMLPVNTPYIDAYPDMTIEEVIEDVVVFDDVYPRRVGTMSEVLPEDDSEVNQTTGEVINFKSYYFKDSDLQFSDKYLLQSQDLRIVFQSGKLNGLDFGVKFNPKSKPLNKEDGSLNPDAQVFKIIRNNDYGRMFPDNVLIPLANDRYILYGWDAEKIAELGLVGKAEEELEKKAREFIKKTMDDPSTYDCTMGTKWAYGIHPETGEPDSGYSQSFAVGKRVNLINEAYFEEGRQTRIIGFEYNLDLLYDSPVYTVGETAAYSRIGELESKVENITYQGSNYTFTSSGGSSNVESYSSRLQKDIHVTAPKTGYINTGNVIMAGQTWEDIFRKMLYEPAQATLKSALSTSNDVEYGSLKGKITYTAARNGQGKMKAAFYDNDAKNILNFSEEIDGIQTATRQLEGKYTQGESYYATVTYKASDNGELPEHMLTDKISVNVRRKWFAGTCSTIPTTSEQVRALSANGLYTGPGTYQFTISNYKTFVICIPADTINHVSLERYVYNFMDLDSAATPRKINVEGANGMSAMEYIMYEFSSKASSPETDKFTFKTK